MLKAADNLDMDAMFHEGIDGSMQEMQIGA